MIIRMTHIPTAVAFALAFGVPVTSTGQEATNSCTSTDIKADIAPKLRELTADVLYADVCELEVLSPRDQSLATISARVAMNRPDQLRSHIRIRRENGLTELEVTETITHLAF